jgi:hypothetical protein
MLPASDLLGVPVASDAPEFLLALGAHVAGGITCVLAGAVAAMTRKAPGRHPRAGLIYYAGIVWVFVSAVVMAVLQWPHDVHLLVIGLVALGTSTAGLFARWRARPGWQRRHIVLMGSSFVAVLTGFYVDNGPHLPLWGHLPAWTFWILPGIPGGLLIVRSARRRRVPGSEGHA